MDDPRVFFAAERTLLAWQRTGLVLLAFGFMIERAGLLLQALSENQPVPDTASFWLGTMFMVLGVVLILVAVRQFLKMLPSFAATEIPKGYRVGLSVGLNIVVALAGIVLILTLIFMRF